MAEHLLHVLATGGRVVPARICGLLAQRNIGVTSIRVYATAQSLFTATKYKGYNPEVNQQGTSPNALGIDYGTYPQARTYIVGFNVEL